MGLKILVRDGVELSSSPDDQDGDAENQARCCLLASDLLAEDNALLQAKRHVGASGIVGGCGKYYEGGAGNRPSTVSLPSCQPNFEPPKFFYFDHHLDCRRCGASFWREENLSYISLSISNMNIPRFKWLCFQNSL